MEISEASKNQVHEMYRAGMARAREESWRVLYQIAENIKPGCLESQANQTAQALLKSAGVEGLWHRPYVRFGANTLKTYRDPFEGETILKESDLFYIDLGPVFSGVPGDSEKYEGDVGESFIVGDDLEHIKITQTVKKIYELTRDSWLKSNLTGEQLYQHARGLADHLGYELESEHACGHRISKFPHEKGGGTLAALNASPLPYEWVLEIQIRHPSLKIGAFFEDLLI